MSAGPLAGIGLALLATTSYNLGLVLEKRALAFLPAVNLRRVVRVVVNLLSSPAWLGGFALMLAGLACQTIVLSFAPVSIVQPVIASGVSLVLVLSRLILRERLGKAELWCVVAMAVAVVVLALSAAGGDGSAGHQVNAVALAAVMVPVGLIGLVVAASPLRSGGRRHRAPVSGVSYGVGTGLLYGDASLAIKGMSGILTRDHGATAIVTGLLASPYLYAMAACSVVAMLLFQAALQACRASIVVPVSSVVGSVYFMIAGTWLFHERLPADPGRLVLRLAGIAVAGVVLVVLSRQSPDTTKGLGEVDDSGQNAARHPSLPDRQAGPALLPGPGGAVQPEAAPPVPGPGRHPDDAGQPGRTGRR
jgi:drug/metabolite transporter (DMT)-like permease